MATQSAVFSPVVALLSVVLAAGMDAKSAEPAGLGHRDRDELLAYARDTWKSVAAMADGSELPVDGLRHHPDGTWKPFPKTTPTNIASYLWSVLAAERMKIIDAGDAARRLDRALRAVTRMDRVHGFYYDELDPFTGRPLKVFPEDGKPIPPIASCVDNGWLAAALIMVRNCPFPARESADALLGPMDFGFFYVPYDRADPRNSPGQVRGPYHIDVKTFGGLHRIINTEQRITSYIGIARGQIPAEHYYRMERTVKAGDQDQSQTPVGQMRTYMDIPVFEGHYSYRGMHFVPSWGGSMFEALMVPLFVPEEIWAPRSWGVNHRIYVRCQIEHGLKEAGYGYWGFSPACDPDGGYRTYGVDALGTDPVGYTSNNDVTGAKKVLNDPKRRFINGIVTPHASFLALRFAPREAMENLRKLKEDFPIYGDYGFMDSVNVSTGKVADRILMLDQGIIMAAIANAIADDAMRKAFSIGRVEQALKPLCAMEEFTAGPASAR